MKYYFGDNREYGAEDIKTALGTLVAKGGIELGLSDGESYDPSALNKMIAAAMSKGVITESSSCLRLNKKDGGYTISPGKGVFSDGGIVEVEEETAVDISPGQYLYIAYSRMLDDVYFLAESAAQTEDERNLLIPIAYVENNGAVKDKREYVEGKVPAAPSATWNVLHEEEFVIDESTVTYGNLAAGGYVEARHPIDGEMNFMLVQRMNTMSVMHIGPQGATYSFIVGAGSRDFGHFEDFMGVGNSGNGYYKATYLGSGTGYIHLRYYFPRGMGRSYSYKALIGIEA